MLDIKSRSNDPAREIEEAKEEEYKIIEKTKKVRKPKNGFIVYLLLLLFLSGIITGFLFLSNHSTGRRVYRNIEDMYQSQMYSLPENDSPERYAKNIYLFFTQYDGYDFDETKLKEQISVDSSDYELNPQHLLDRANVEMVFGELLNRFNNEKNNVDSFTSIEYYDETTGQNYNFTSAQEIIALRDEKLKLIDVTYENLYKSNESKASTVLEESVKNYYNIRNYLESNKNFGFMIRDNNGKTYYCNEGKVASLSDKEIEIYERDINGLNSAFVFPLFSEKVGFYFNNEPLNESFRKNNINGYFFATNTLISSVDSVASNEQMSVYAFQDFLSAFISLCFISLLVLLFICRHDFGAFKRGSAIIYNFYAKFPLILKLLGFVIFPIFYFLVSENPSHMRYFVDVIIGTKAYMFFVYFIKHIFKNFKNLKNEPEFKIIRRIFKDFHYVNKSGKIFTIILFYSMFVIFGVFGTGLYVFGSLAILLENEPAIVLLATALYAVAMLFYKYYMDFTIGYCKLCYYIKKIYEGSDEYIEEQNPAKQEIYYLNNLRRGFIESVNKMIKAERMKTQLITNVSHDLKTPLTSIINYLELLKKEGMQGAHTNEYLEILEAKSQRLKYLIEDLFEASKLTAGEVELNLDKVNVCDLINQTVGELSGKLEDANIDLRTKFDSENIYLKLDGKKIWRVFENLLNNIIKYSLSGTRAYIDVQEEINEVIITFKNISNHEIKFDKSELFDRFKRGDDSRSTDGNGLGLSIAQSIINLHGGFIDIVVDGDLFKVVITFRKKC